MRFSQSSGLVDITPWLAEPFDAGGIDPSSVASAGPVAVQVTAPALTPQALFATEAGDASAISVDDIHQGQIGDCFLLSSIGELALHDPADITGMIKATGATSQTVTLYGTSAGHVPGYGATAFKSLTEAVTDTFQANAADNGATQDVVNGQKEIWVQVLEKAYAQQNGGYAGIADGGNPTIAMQQLTGHTALAQSVSSATVTALMTDVANNDLVVMDTGSSGLGYGLFGSHAYMFEGLVGTGAAAAVKLGNPWGFDNPSLIPVAALSHSGIVEVDVGHG